MEERTWFMGMKDGEELAKFIMEHAKEENLSVTLTIEPSRTEIRVEPFKDVVMYCPYHRD